MFPSRLVIWMLAGIGALGSGMAMAQSYPQKPVRVGIFAPAKTPPMLIKRLNQEIVRVLNRPEVKGRFLKVGSEVVGSSPEELTAMMKSEMARWVKLIKDAGGD